MHQNKIPRPAENRIIRIGDGAVFLIFLQIRCVAPSMANTAIERKSGANPACKSVRPNSVDSAMLSAVARIIATTHGRTPDKKALTGAYFIRFFSADARTAQAAVVRALPRFASDFHPESDPAASSKTSRTGTLTLSQRSKLHLPHTLTVRSDSEALLQRFVFAQR